MRSSGLIYAVIVGAWAAYLVPMWLRRQDELNEARPTERFSTAIRLLSGRAAMQRRYDKAHGGYPADDASADLPAPDPDAPADEAAAGPFGDPAAVDGSASPHGSEAPTRVQPAPPRPSLSERAKRAKVLARRRRTITVLFLAFTAGAVVAAVGGLPFLWAPALPALLLTAYIMYLRAQERRRFTFTMDQRKAEAAAQRLREGRHRPRQTADQPPADAHPADARADGGGAGLPAAPAPEPPRAVAPSPAAGRRAVVEETDHAEWVDQQRERPRPAAGGWEPVPVPLPTYVTAPVAPRATSHVDLDADDAWSSARSSAAPDRPQPKPKHQSDAPARRPRGRTPLFDQYEDEDRPRAANE
ncbi:gephyrin-like molybdotransferase receptor GlpR [Streptomyces sp. NPDC001339]|uniref:divisome protein SepX/GlpR n=1 Tax=Streptomyces sp. NPDC001339 TaxID=3364563 RepID=UPI0036A02817